MSGDRFELELRDVLREEAAAAPVVLTLGELRSRAAPRSRWGRWFGTGRLALAVAVLAIAVVALVVSLNPSRPLPSVGSSPSVPAASESAEVPSSIAPSIAAFSPLPISLGPVDTVIVLGAGDDSIDVLGARPDGAFTPISHIVDISARLGEWRLPDATDGPLDGAVSATGVLAIAVVRGDVDNPEYATAIVPLFGTGPFPIVPARGALAFEADGTLVIVGPAIVRSSPPYAELETLAIPPSVVVDSSSGRPSLLADGSGLYGLQESLNAAGDLLPYRTPVSIGWDGSIAAADPSVAPRFVTGNDRAFGADGQTASPWSETSGDGTSDSGLSVEGPATRRIETGIHGARSVAWSPDGRTLYVVTDSALLAFDGRTTRTVATLRAAKDATAIVGFTRTSILVQTSGGLTVGVHLDGSGEDGVGESVVGVVG